MMSSALKVMVLAGGPDREREVSLVSGQQVAEGLKQGGHDVLLRDISPDNLDALDEFQQWGGDTLFLALHGPWGEGGGLQRILDQRDYPYFGCRADAAELSMDKVATKEALRDADIPTPAHEVIDTKAQGWPSLGLGFDLPYVIKPIREGSSIDVYICRTPPEVDAALTDIAKRHDRVMVEQFIEGPELTVGIIGGPEGDIALPPLQIIPATTFYDYDAKYQRDDTRYEFDIDLPPEVLSQISDLALRTHHALGCRHLSRVDFIVDADHTPWCLELNTIPGFTTHSLVPKAAAHHGIPWTELVDRLARLGAVSCTA